MLSSKTVIVSGGTRGIGHAIALFCASQGAKVAVLGRNDQTLNAALVALKGIDSTLSNHHLALKCDVADPLAVAKAVKTVETTIGTTTVLVNAAGGNIINISSVVGMTGNIGQSAYSASKAGLIGFSKSLAKEVGSRKIRVNVIAPGFINTLMTKDMSETSRDAIISKLSIKRFGETDDVVEVVKFLLSCNYITGQVIRVDGGLIL